MVSAGTTADACECEYEYERKRVPFRPQWGAQGNIFFLPARENFCVCVRA